MEFPSHFILMWPWTKKKLTLALYLENIYLFDWEVVCVLFVVALDLLYKLSALLQGQLVEQMFEH